MIGPFDDVVVVALALRFAAKRVPLRDLRPLAAPSHHRVLSIIDPLVAAAAEARDLVGPNHHAEFELVSEITGQAQE